MSAAGQPSIPDPARPLWHRRPKEPSRAYAAFKTYLEMGPSRNIRAIVRKPGRSRATLEDWSRKNEWGERAKAYDEHHDELQRKAHEDAMKAEAAKWAQRQVQVRDQSWELAQALISKAKAMLEYPIAKKTIEDGGSIVHLHPQKFSIGQAAKMIEVGDKLARLAANLHTEKTEITGPENAPIVPTGIGQVVIVELPANGREKLNG